MRAFIPVLCLILLAGSASADPDVYARGVRSAAFLHYREGDSTCIGTGVLVDAKRKLVLTNSHVVGDREQVTVVFPEFRGGEPIHEADHYFKNLRRIGIAGRVVHNDSKRDLALVELEHLPDGVQAIELGSRSPRPGETLHAIGNSGAFVGAMWRYVRGEVRQVSQRELKFHNGTPVKARMVETQIPTNPGDSGGPVLDGRGRLVALTQGAQTDQDLVRYAVDLSEIAGFLAEYSESKTVRRSTKTTSLLEGLTQHGATATATTHGRFRGEAVPGPDGTLRSWKVEIGNEGVRAETSGGFATVQIVGNRLELNLRGTQVLAGRIRQIGSTVFMLTTIEGKCISFHRE